MDYELRLILEKVSIPNLHTGRYHALVEIYGSFGMLHLPCLFATRFFQQVLAWWHGTVV